MDGITYAMGDLANNIAAQYSLNPILMQIIFAIITITAVFLAIRLARKAIRFIFTVIAFIGLAMTLYGEQILQWFIQLIISKM